MNYYKKVAQMFGIELNEEFSLKNEDDELLSSKYKVSECEGLLFKWNNNWCRSGYLDEIISGKLTVVKLPWKPYLTESYYAYSAYDKTVIETKWLGATEDLLYWKLGNCFKTREEAGTKGKAIMEQIEKEFES